MNFKMTWPSVVWSAGVELATSEVPTGGDRIAIGDIKKIKGLDGLFTIA